MLGEMALTTLEEKNNFCLIANAEMLIGKCLKHLLSQVYVHHTKKSRRQAKEKEEDDLLGGPQEICL